MKISLRYLLVPALLLSLVASAPSYAPQAPFLQLMVEDMASSARVTLSSNILLRSSVEKNGVYLLVRVRAEQAFRIRRGAFQSRFIDSIGWTQGENFYVLNIKTKLTEFDYVSSTLTEPSRLVIDLLPKGVTLESTAPEEGGKPAQPVSPPKGSESGVERSRPEVSRPASPPAQSPAQSLRTIIIDPGHGGLEVGATGPSGTLEKDITLPLSQKLKAIIERNLSYRVVLTRDRDVDVPLERRAAIANNERAFLFISIHANGYRRTKARGAETYFLNLNATDEESRRLAYMENKSTEMDQVQDVTEDPINMILWDMAQSNYLKQSSQLAEYIQAELNTLRGTRNRGVKQAPFKVLTGVACPAVLVEVAFISNPEEESKLITEDFRTAVAQAIFAGLAKFIWQQGNE